MDTKTIYLLAISLYMSLPASQSQVAQSALWKYDSPLLIETEEVGGSPVSLDVQDRTAVEEATFLLARSRSAHLGRDSKLCIFIAAAVGTVTLMGVVYCIYNQFYSKRLFAHTQLEDDAEEMLDPPDSSSCSFSCYPTKSDEEKKKSLGGYGAITAPPSIINIPANFQSTPTLAAPFPPPFPPSPSTRLQTISAQNLEKSFV